MRSSYHANVQRGMKTRSRNNGSIGLLSAPQPAALHSSRDVSATAASAIPQRDPLDVSFNNPIDAFKSKTTWELVRAYVVYLMCSSEYLVENNMKVSLKIISNS